MAVAVRQSSFAAGEVSPAVSQRSDLDWYTSALRLARNWIPLPQGGLTVRPGLPYVGETIESRRPRFIPFVFSPELGQTYLLVFTHLKLRIVWDGGYVLNGFGPGASIVEIDAPYAEADLPRLVTTQSADVVTITCHGYLPQELRRTSHDTWGFADVAVERWASPPTGLNATQAAGQADETHPGRNWRYVVAASKDGRLTLPSARFLIFAALYSDKMPVVLTWNPVAGADFYVVYKSRSDSFYGFIGRVKPFNPLLPNFEDDGIAPVYNEGPPEGIDPWTAVEKYPAVCAYFDQRQFFANTPEGPQTILASRAADFRNFDRSLPANEDDSFERTLASGTLDDIRAMVQIQGKLVAMTTMAEWVIAAPQEQTITGTNIVARARTYYGSGWVQPIPIGKALLFVTSKGRGVREFVFDFVSDGYDARDLCIRAAHLLDGHTIVSWAYAESPHSCVWAVRDDGVLLGLTYVPEQQVWGWHQHVTDGVVEEVGVVPEGAVDAVYLCVRRVVQGVERRYIERMASEERPDPRDVCLLDSALSYDGRNQDPTLTLELSAGTWGSDAEVTCDASADVFTGQDVGAKVILEQGEDSVRGRILTMDGPRRVTLQVESAVAASLQEAPTATWSVARKVVHGLDHLEGCLVRSIRDGNANENEALLVSGGAVTLPTHAVVIHVGLPYTPRAETLDLPYDKGAPVTAAEVLLEVTKTRGLWLGERDGELSRHVQRQASMGFGTIPLKEDPITFRPKNSNTFHGGLVIEQRVPLPATVLAITPKVTRGN